MAAALLTKINALLELDIMDFLEVAMMITFHGLEQVTRSYTKNIPM